MYGNVISILIILQIYCIDKLKMKISAVTIIFFTSAITSSYAKKNGDGSFSAPCGSEGDEKCMKPYKCVPWYNGQPFGCGSGTYS